MTNLSGDARRRIPALRPLVGGLAVAIAGLAAAPLAAGELDNAFHEVVSGDARELWTLSNGAELRVNGGNAYSINATGGSLAMLLNARVERGPFDYAAVTLRNGCLLYTSDAADE